MLNISGTRLKNQSLAIFFLVPEVAPFVKVSDMTDTSSISISWTAIPEEYATGKLLGYHIMYTPVKVAGKQLKEDARMNTIAVDHPGNLHARLTGLESFTSYSIRVAGFTAKGDGIASTHVIGGNSKMQIEKCLQIYLHLCHFLLASIWLRRCRSIGRFIICIPSY